MNSKIFSLFLLTVLSLTLVSAALTVSQPGILTKVNNNVTFTVSNSDVVPVIIEFQPVSFTDGTNTVTLSVTGTKTIAAAGSQTFVLALPSTLPSLKLGSWPITLTAYEVANTSNTDTKTTSFTSEYCQDGNIGGTNLVITSITDEELDNDDAWTWHPLDNIELTVKVRNNVDDEVDVTIEYDLYDPDLDEFIGLDDNTIDVTIDETDSEEVTIEFQLPAKDVDDKTNYILYVKAYDEDGEDEACAESFKTGVKVEKEKNSVVIDDISIDTPVACGEEVSLSLTVLNTGEEKEKRVLVTAYNKELGIDLTRVLESFKSGDEEEVTFNLQIPSSASEKIFRIELTTYFDYDDNNGGCTEDDQTACYDQDSFDDLDESYIASVKVEGCKLTSLSEITITSLVPATVEPGQDITIKSTIKNNAKVESAFAITASGYESFASDFKIDQQNFNLKAGESKEITITFTLDEDATGDNSFTLKTTSGLLSKDTKIQLPNSAQKPGAFSGFFDSIKSNWVIWVIVLVNVVLIVLIIIVAVRIIKK